MIPKIALVTGAPGIIGPGICQTLREAGWKIAAHALEKEDWSLFEKIEDRVFPADLPLEGDLGNRDTCHNIARQVREQLGPVSLLVNNAAFNPSPPPALEDLSEDYALQMLRVNLLAPLFLLQACLPDLKSGKESSVVNVGSIQSELPLPGQMLYPASKAALETLTQIWARDLAPHQIRVNAIRVGSVPGPGFLWADLRRLPTEKARCLYRELLPVHLENSSGLSPSGKIATPADVGQLVAFLASSPAISGATVPLDAGLSSTRKFTIGNSDWNFQAALQEWLRANE